MKKLSSTENELKKGVARKKRSVYKRGTTDHRSNYYPVLYPQSRNVQTSNTNTKDCRGYHVFIHVVSNTLRSIKGIEC